MKSSTVILACAITGIATAYLGLRAGVRVGRNQAAHDAVDVRRTLGLAISDMVDHANQGNFETLRSQVVLFYDRWYDIEFVPEADTPPNRRAENIAVSIMRSEKQK